MKASLKLYELFFIILFSTVWADKSAPGGSGSLAVWDPMTDDYKSAAFNSYKEPSTQELARCIPGYSFIPTFIRYGTTKIQ